jgi:hypothetical protein
MKLGRKVTYMGEMKNAYKIFEFEDLNENIEHGKRTYE